jgi:hypothetical protein
VQSWPFVGGLVMGSWTRKRISGGIELCRIVHLQVFLKLCPTSFFLHLSSEGVAYGQLEVFIFTLGANIVLLDRLTYSH